MPKKVWRRLEELTIRRKLLYEWRAAYRKLGAARLNRKLGGKHEAARQAARATRTARPVTVTRCNATPSMSTPLTSSTSNRTSTIASAPYSAASRFKASIAVWRSASELGLSAARQRAAALIASYRRDLAAVIETA